MKTRVCIAAVLWIVMCIGSSWAGDGKLEIPGGTNAYTITQAGSYILTGNLSVDSGIAIWVQSDAVTLDLGGFRVGVNSTSADSACVRLETCNNVKLRNGVLAGGYDAIKSTGSNGSTLEDMRITGARRGVYILNCTNNVIRNCTVSDFFWHGIYIDDGCHLTLVEGNTVSDSTWGIYVHASFSAPNLACRIVGNQVTDCSDIGIYGYTSPGLEIADNSVAGCGTGIQLTGGTEGSRILGNSICKNTESGIEIYGASRVTIDSNNIVGNTEYGITFVTGAATNLYMNNVIRNNDFGTLGGLISSQWDGGDNKMD